jgi:hypothetical protein
MPNENIYFPVELQPVGFHAKDTLNGYPGLTDKFKAVVRTDTNDVLAVHKSNYKLLKNKDLFPVFEEAMKQSDIDMRGMMVSDQTSHGGARVLRTYRFPKHRVDVGREDNLDLQVILRNSYDGSWAFGFMMGAFRMVCSNGMIIGDKITDIKSKHTKNMTIDPYVNALNHSVAAYLEQAEQWRTWKGIEIHRRQVITLLEQMPNLTDRIRDRVRSQFMNQRGEMGTNIWNLYNALTYWATHGEVRQDAVDNYPAIQLGRSEEVRKVINHPVWQAYIDKEAA